MVVCDCRGSGNAAFLQPLAKDKGILWLLVSRVNNICSTVICCLATKAPCTVLTHQWVLQMRRHNDALFKACLELHPHGNYQTLLDKLITWFCLLKRMLIFYSCALSEQQCSHTERRLCPHLQFYWFTVIQIKYRSRTDNRLDKKSQGIFYLIPEGMRALRNSFLLCISERMP